MSAYICEKCGVIDNTAVGGYWGNCRNNQPKMCSECNTGSWHGHFPKRHWSDYGMEQLLEWEDRHDGSMINARYFFRKNGMLPEPGNLSKRDQEGCSG